MATKVERTKFNYTNKSSAYLITSEDLQNDCFRKQFYFLYRARIELLFPRIMENAQRLIDPDIKATQLADISGNENFFVVGVILKKMKYRRSVLYDFQDEDTLDFEFREKLKSDCLVSDEDILEFEGDQQIIKLIGNIDKDRFVTGNVLGLYGHITKDDVFEVRTTVFPTLASQIPWPIIEKDCYVAFLSGISLNSDMAVNANTLYALEKLSAWLCAEICLSDKELEIVQNIGRLVIAGDSIKISNKDVEAQCIEFLGSDQEIDKSAIAQFDKVLNRLVTAVHVDLMSGANDPTSILLPQQPIPRLVLPWSRRFGKLLNTVTNPYKFCLNGITFIGTSGQNINDLSRLTLGQSPLELMQSSLLSAHLFPTVPDSIDGFPLQRRDPFIVDEMPHVFFVGNQKHLEHMWMHSPDESKSFTASSSKETKTLLLTIPVFKSNLSLTLLNLRNMRISEYDFSQENFL